LLGECRLHGGCVDLGFFEANVRDAIRALEALRPPRLAPTPEQAVLRDRLLARMMVLIDGQSMRRRVHAESGGPETFLHGDLWTTNIFVEPVADAYRVRFIDWDPAAVGPAADDLSPLFLR